jgi:signal transduction histidine kinase
VESRSLGDSKAALAHFFESVFSISVATAVRTFNMIWISQYLVDSSRQRVWTENGAHDLSGIMSTITPSKLPESHERSNDRLSGAFQAGIILVDSQNKISVFTETAGRFLGCATPPWEVEGLPAWLQTLIAKARLDGEPRLDQDVTFDDVTPTRVLRISILPVESHKNPVPVTIVLQDASADIEKNLYQLDRLANFGMLSAGIAHEIKNALVVGKTFFDLLLEKYQDAELVPLVRRELKRIEALVTQMVRYNTPVKPTFARIHLHEVLNHSLLMVEHQLKDKVIKLEKDYSLSSDELPGDEFQLEQAFVNLLLNAVDAMGPGGRLSVTTRGGAEILRTGLPTEVGQFEVRIQDSGIGISPENINRLFDPFFTTKTGGTGLGLSITRQIIEQHGGHIEVTSQPKAGTCFQIFLPSFEAA